MGTNNLFQSWTNQNQGNSFGNGNSNYYRYGDMNMNMNQPQPYGGSFINRSPSSTPSGIPVRVVFSPEQIAPQEIPTNGTPALFPLSDGSKIIARSLSGNGLFEERVYVLQETSNQMGTESEQPSEFDQVMMRLGGIEESLNRVLNDLYGSKNQSTQEGSIE